MATFYDMMRDKARNMGHAAADASNAAFEKTIQAKDRTYNLTAAKFCIQQYMLGEMDPQQMAQWMADNPDMRVAMSDLCRIRLEPVEFNVQRGDGYIDVGAGIRTFWTEMKVPLPSERDAARDLLNINYGIEAGKQASAQGQASSQKPFRQSLRDKINGMKQDAARKAIDVLTPVAEGKQEIASENPAPAPHISELNESWFETEEGRQYKNDVTRRMAVQLENMSMTIEAGLDPNIPEPEREKALQAAHVNGAKPANLRAGYTREELNEPLDTSMKALFDQIAQHMGQDVKQEPKQKASARDQGTEKQVSFSREKGKIVGEFDGKKVRFKENFRDHVFTDDEAASLLQGKDIIVDYTDKNDKERKVAGKLEWQTYEGRRFLGFKADFSKNLDETQRILSEKQKLPVPEPAEEKQPEHTAEETPDPQMSNGDVHNLFGDEDDYYEKMAKDMEGYIPEDQPVLELNENDLQFGSSPNADFELART